MIKATSFSSSSQYWGAAVANDAALIAITNQYRIDRQQRLVEADGSVFRYDEQAAAGNLKPTDSDGTGAGSGNGWWILLQPATDHEGLTGLQGGVVNNHAHLTAAQAIIAIQTNALTGILWVSKNGNDANTGTLGAPFLTIAAAIAAASAGTTILIQPGTYTENLTLVAGVSLQGQQARSCFVTGNVTAAFNGTTYLHSIDFQASAGDVFTFSGANATNLQLDDCHIDSLTGGGHCINHTNTNAASKLNCDNGAFNVAVSTTAKIFNSAASSAGSVIWEDISARILDNLDHVCLNVAGALTFSHLFDDIHGQVVVANTAAYSGVDITMQTATISILVTNSTGLSTLANIVAITTAIPLVTGAGGFAQGLVGYISTGHGFASTLNGGAGSITFSTGDVKVIGKHSIIGVPVYANNAAAIAGGLSAGDTYRTNVDPDFLAIVH